MSATHTSVLATFARLEFAGFWIRAAATTIDAIVLWIPVVFLSSFLSQRYLGSHSAKVGDAIAMLSIWVPYWVMSWTSAWQSTLGHKVLGLVITDESGNRITLARALVRAAVAVIGGFLIFGALFVPFTEKRQALHDLIAKTHVVYAKVLERRSNTSLERTREG